MESQVVQLPGMDEGDVVEVSTVNDKLVITTPDWICSRTNPVRIEIDDWAVKELGGQDRIVEALAAFCKVLDGE